MTKHKKSKKISYRKILIPITILLVLIVSAVLINQLAFSKDNSKDLTTDDVEEVVKKLNEEAEKQNIEVTDDEVNSFINAGLNVSGLTKEEFEVQLEESGMTYDQYVDALTEQMKISKLIEENVDLESVTVTQKDVDAYIEEGFDELFQGDEETLMAFEQNVKQELLMKKQQELIIDYVNTLE